VINASDRHHRRSIRLKGYNYARAGAYFVTLCTQDRLCLFGDVVDGAVRLNRYGEHMVRWWKDVPRHFAAVNMDAFVVMPNHVHGIIVITNAPAAAVGAGFPRPDSRPGDNRDMGIGGGGTPPLQMGDIANCGTPPQRRPSLGNIMAYFKYQSTKQINALRQTPADRVWQRNYYEHIIRNQASLDRIRQYIRDNPAQWAFDRDNPGGGKGGETPPLRGHIANCGTPPLPGGIRQIQPEKKIGGKSNER
jgi:REP element-mobilizing transposase RayT